MSTLARKSKFLQFFAKIFLKLKYTQSFFYVHFFYGLKDLDRKRRNRLRDKFLEVPKIKVPTIPAVITTTYFYGHFFYGPTFSLHARP